MTVFLTGASGFWGRHLKKELNRRGYQVFAPSHSDYDLLNSDDVDFLLDAAHPDYIIHASANCGGLPYNKANPYTLFRDNAFMGNNLIDA